MYKTLLILFSLVSFTIPYLGYAQEVKTFGRRGNNGNNGLNGRSGENGKNKDIWVDNTAVKVDLSGTKGEDGSDGKYGSPASQCQQPQNPAFNLKGADGGNGGNGGDGGNGGNGGNVTIYFQDIASLKKITVDNSGGEGGRSGRGAEGGQGCSLGKKNWQVKFCRWELWQRRKDVDNAQWRSRRTKMTRCQGVRDYDLRNHRPAYPRVQSNLALRWQYDGVQKVESFQAEAGKQGQSGNDGKQGTNGNYGQVTLVPTDKIPTERISHQDSLLNLLDKKVDLVRNIWQEKSDLQSLLNPASDVADNYIYLLDTARLSYLLEWQAEKSPQQLEIEPAMMVSGEIFLNNLQPQMSLNLSQIPGTIEYDLTTQGDVTIVKITDGFAPSRMQSFRLDDFKADQFEQITLIDDGNVRELLRNTTVKVITAKKDASGTYQARDQVVFVIPPNKLPRGNMGVEGNQYNLNIGRNLFAWMKSGADIRYDIEITQTTKRGIEYQQDLQVQFVIP